MRNGARSTRLKVARGAREDRKIAIFPRKKSTMEPAKDPYDKQLHARVWYIHWPIALK